MPMLASDAAAKGRMFPGGENEDEKDRQRHEIEEGLLGRQTIGLSKEVKTRNRHSGREMSNASSVTEREAHC
jgi:hypothetical protein